MARGVLALAVALAACGDNIVRDCIDTPDACRAACGYGAGDPASLTLRDFPTGRAIPIDHVILVMQENRTFDHYFSSLAVPGQTVDGAAPDATNPDPQHPGQTISRFHQTAYCFDNPAESWDEVHEEVDGGAMDRFTTVNASDDPTGDPSGARALGYYDETDLPYYYALARAFAISDRHFASALTNTWPNRLFYMAGTAYGDTSDVFPDHQDDGDGNVYPNLFTELNAAKVSWAFYVQDLPTLAILDETWSRNLMHVLPYQQFYDDAAAGALPAVTFVEGTDMAGGVSPDEDPPADMQVGEAMVAQIVAAVTGSPQWPRSALFVSFDEQGGLYDHVPPPPACAPDDFAPELAPTGFQAAWDQYGLRVPLIVVSPYARRGYVSHVITDHTSILRFVEARFGLAALTHRDANAMPPYDMFDFAHPDRSVPDLPDAPIDPAQQAACMAKYPGKSSSGPPD
ncbi:MAG TPA: alkaline phosphatase family protein [Kofleriaceae bacterium]|nr:alkaline phosphatase family protein [Kofleriaceae bacterium]